MVGKASLLLVEIWEKIVSWRKGVEKVEGNWLETQDGDEKQHVLNIHKGFWVCPISCTIWRALQAVRVSSPEIGSLCFNWEFSTSSKGNGELHSPHTPRHALCLVLWTTRQAHKELKLVTSNNLKILWTFQEEHGWLFLEELIGLLPFSECQEGREEPWDPNETSRDPQLLSREQSLNEAVGFPASGLLTSQFIPSVWKFKTILFYDVARVQIRIT